MERLPALVLAFIIALAQPAWAETRYFAEIEDVPLAPGLAETQAGVGFASERGAILTAAAEGRGASAGVRAFYEAALPPLGWSQSPPSAQSGEMVFQRGRELLSLRIEARDGQVRLSVRLVERPASMRVD